MTIGSAINDVAALFGVPGQSFFDQLEPASWKNVPFGVTASRGRFGRRNAVHDYPYRDDPWVEDLGRARRQLHLTGFLVGDDLKAQANRMIAACEKRNDSDQGGELVHPLFGRDRFVLLDFSLSTDVEGRYCVLEFDFIRSAGRIYPTSAVATPEETLASADDADAAAGTSFYGRIAAALKQGAAAVQSVVATVQKYGGVVFRLANDATSLVRTVQALPGEFGRFFAGARSTLFGPAAAASGTPNTPSTVPDLIAAGATSRAAVTAAMTAAQSGAAGLSAATALGFAGQSQAVMTALAAATNDPADRVRLFSTLAGFVPPVQGTPAVATVRAATADLWRRAALTALARASAAYAPSSYDDAAALRAALVALLDGEIGIAGDQGEDDVFLAFRALKTAVMADLTSRGATLSAIVTVSFSAPLPAPLIAMKLYQDAARAGELIGEANVRHPAFMPTSFKALAR